MLEPCDLLVRHLVAETVADFRVDPVGLHDQAVTIFADGRVYVIGEELASVFAKFDTWILPHEAAQTFG